MAFHYFRSELLWLTQSKTIKNINILVTLNKIVSEIKLNILFKLFIFFN